ncbi:MAG: sigma-70 family RNA polymerase sigma factor [Planctomycetales bacterium]|nr:sigma-70 family RNA polymerase sigma factor [Planctomycetales bacterium]
MQREENPSLGSVGEGPCELERLFAENRHRLKRMVGLRMDRRLQGRVDPSDVVQEAYVDALARFPQYCAERQVPPFIWLRFIVGQKLLQLARTHLGAQKRSASREVSLFAGSAPEATSASLADQLMGKRTSPSNACARAELKIRVENSLACLEEIDREVLALRHFEQLTNAEAAQLLSITEAACYKRYVRALRRLKEVMCDWQS